MSNLLAHTEMHQDMERKNHTHNTGTSEVVAAAPEWNVCSEQTVGKNARTRTCVYARAPHAGKGSERLCTRRINNLHTERHTGKQAERGTSTCREVFLVCEVFPPYVHVPMGRWAVSFGACACVRAHVCVRLYLVGCSVSFGACACVRAHVCARLYLVGCSRYGN